ncbi:MAG: hypothetical protein J0G97_04430 [Rhizobium pusense]|nr:hypothetical protein [Agrobacterium pusense]
MRARQARLEAKRDDRPDVITPDDLRARLKHIEAETATSSERRLFEDRHISRDGQKARLRKHIQQLHEQIAGLDVQQRAKAGEIELIRKDLVGIRKLYDMGSSP